METLCPSATIIYRFPIDFRKASIQFSVPNPINFPISQKNHSCITLSSSISCISHFTKASAASTSNSSSFTIPDPNCNSNKKDYSFSSIESRKISNPYLGGFPLFPSGNTGHWLVRMDKPGVGVVTKAQMVDYYAQILAKVLGNEKDAQVCIYHVSWQSNFGFCCELDDECAKELAGVPGVLSVEPDRNFASDNKDYEGSKLQGSTNQPESSEASDMMPVRTKKLFVTGLSFYTSEKTLRSAFEGFGELVEVKIIMDKISKRSKGYAFVEYTTEEAASAALKEMNGKIINGWMITVDVAKSRSYKFRRDQPRTSV